MVDSRHTCLSSSKIGAGTALPSIVAYHCGGKVTISDGEFYPECLKLSKRNFELNGISPCNLRTIGLSWGIVNPALLTLDPVDIVLGSDCFYDPKDFEDVIASIAFIFDRNPNCKFWTTYQQRRYVKNMSVYFILSTNNGIFSTDWSIASLLDKWNLIAFEVPLECFKAEGTNVAGSELPGRHTIKLFNISQK